MGTKTKKTKVAKVTKRTLTSDELIQEIAEILPTERMWRTLVRVRNVCRDAVVLYIPARGYGEMAVCYKQAIPPAIFKTMKPDARYHVECNIGAEDWNDLCFDRWETE